MISSCIFLKLENETSVFMSDSFSTRNWIIHPLLVSQAQKSFQTIIKQNQIYKDLINDVPWKNINIALHAAADSRAPLFIFSLSSSHFQKSFLPPWSSLPRKILLTKSSSFMRDSWSQEGAQCWKTSLTQPSSSDVRWQAGHLKCISDRAVPILTEEPMQIFPSRIAQSVWDQWEHKSQPIQRQVLTSKSNLLHITHMQRLQKPFRMVHISQVQSSAGSWFWQAIFLHLLYTKTSMRVVWERLIFGCKKAWIPVLMATRISSCTLWALINVFAVKSFLRWTS